MDRETINYIIKNFPKLMTNLEKQAISHSIFKDKLNNATFNIGTLASVYKQNGWLTSDPNVLDLLKDGFELFKLKTASRILNENREMVFLNNCPKCHKLARTPNARQCRFCGHNWHGLTVAQFRLEITYQFTGGEILFTWPNRQWSHKKGTIYGPHNIWSK